MTPGSTTPVKRSRIPVATAGRLVIACASASSGELFAQTSAAGAPPANAVPRPAVSGTIAKQPRTFGLPLPS